MKLTATTLFFLLYSLLQSESADALSYHFESANPIIDNEYFKFEIYYFDSINPANTQLILILKNKQPFGDYPLSIFLTLNEKWPKAKKKVQCISFNSYVNFKDTILFQPLIQGNIKFPTKIFLNIIDQNESNERVYNYGPIIFKEGPAYVNYINDKYKLEYNSSDLDKSLRTHYPLFEQWLKDGNDTVVALPSMQIIEYGEDRMFGHFSIPDFSYEAGESDRHVGVGGLTPNVHYISRAVGIRSSNIIFTKVKEFNQLFPLTVDSIFYCPDTIYIDSPKIVHVKMSKFTLKKLIKENKLRGYEITDSMLLESKELKVQLISTNESLIKVTPVTDDKQSLTDYTITNWEWNLMPIHEGEDNLILNIALITNQGIKNVIFPFNSKNILVINENKITVMGSVLDFLKNKYEFIIGAVALPSLFFIIPYVIRRRNKRNLNSRNGRVQLKSKFNWKNLFKLRKKRNKDETEEKKELPLASMRSTVLFSYRIAKAFPGLRGLEWIDKPKVAVQRLEILLQEPLSFRHNEAIDSESDPIWWYRDGNMYVETFKRLSSTKVLMNNEELEIKRIAAYQGTQHHKCFVYVEAKGEKQTGVYNITDEDKKRHIERFGYSWEEYGLLGKKVFRREHYDDGATLHKGKVIDTFGAELRIRHLTDYNFILTGKGSPYNSNRFDREAPEMLNNVLKGKIKADDFLEYLLTYTRNED